MGLQVHRSPSTARVSTCPPHHAKNIHYVLPLLRVHMGEIIAGEMGTGFDATAFSRVCIHRPPQVLARKGGNLGVSRFQAAVDW